MRIKNVDLLDKEYLRARSRLIDMKKAQTLRYGAPASGGTVYLTAADATGMMVSYIQSNYQGFGSGIVVDGNDIVAVHQAAIRAVDRARSGGGPTLIECKTYRQRAHTERRGQPDSRDKAEVAAWTQRDPIALLERQMRDQGDLDDAGLQTIERDVMAALEAAVAFAEASPFPLPEQATDDVFAA